MILKKQLYQLATETPKQQSLLKAECVCNCQNRKSEKLELGMDHNSSS